MRRFLMFVVALVAGCGGSDPVSPPPPGPTDVILVSASANKADTEINDHVTVQLRNDGGPGDFYLWFVGVDLISPTPVGCKVEPGATCPAPQDNLGTSESVIVTDTFSETEHYTVPAADVSSVRVFSRSVNSGEYTMTGCKVVRAGGSCP